MVMCRSFIECLKPVELVITIIINIINSSIAIIYYYYHISSIPITNISIL